MATAAPRKEEKGKEIPQTRNYATKKWVRLQVEIYQKLRQTWLRHILAKKKKSQTPAKTSGSASEKRTRQVAADCRFCQRDKRKRKSAERELPVAWSLQKGKGGPKKKITTSGYFCPNQACEYYGINDEGIHALVGHGTHEVIRDFKR